MPSISVPPSLLHLGLGPVLLSHLPGPDAFAGGTQVSVEEGSATWGGLSLGPGRGWGIREGRLAPPCPEGSTPLIRIAFKPPPLTPLWAPALALSCMGHCHAHHGLPLPCFDLG